MQPHYITLHVVRRALYKSDQVGVFNRLCAISATAPGVNRSRWIPAEFHKQPGNHGKARAGADRTTRAPTGLSAR